MIAKTMQMGTEEQQKKDIQPGKNTAKDTLLEDLLKRAISNGKTFSDKEREMVKKARSDLLYNSYVNAIVSNGEYDAFKSEIMGVGSKQYYAHEINPEVVKRFLGRWIIKQENAFKKGGIKERIGLIAVAPERGISPVRVDLSMYGLPSRTYEVIGYNFLTDLLIMDEVFPKARIGKIRFVTANYRDYEAVKGEIEAASGFDLSTKVTLGELFFFYDRLQKDFADKCVLKFTYPDEGGNKEYTYPELIRRYERGKGRGFDYNQETPIVLQKQVVFK